MDYLNFKNITDIGSNIVTIAAVIIAYIGG
jgi:hypothetical protein